MATSTAGDGGTGGIANLWEPYGLRSTPFFQEELRVGDPEHPVELFVGREVELRRLVRRVVSDSSSRSIVQGEPGVGKTSFINRLKAEVAARGVATYEHPIRMQRGSTAPSVIADVLRLLLRIRLGSGWTRDPGGFWGRTTRLLEGGELLGGSVGGLGISGGITRSYVAPQVGLDSLYEHLGEGLSRICEASGGVLVHVNNLENLTEADAGEAAALLRDLRDHLMLPGAHWIFVGATGVEEAFRRHAQVDGIFPAGETLQPLSAEEMEALLRMRYEHLRLARRKLVPPVEPRVAAALYGIYQGDLRNFLRLLGDAAERGLGLAGAHPMTGEEILRHTAGGYEMDLRARCGESDFGHLDAITRTLQAPFEFRVTEAARLLGMKQSSASQLVERLLRARVIRRVRTAGKSVYYRPVGGVLVACGVVGPAEGPVPGE